MDLFGEPLHHADIGRHGPILCEVSQWIPRAVQLTRRGRIPTAQGARVRPRKVIVTFIVIAIDFNFTPEALHSRNSKLCVPSTYDRSLGVLAPLGERDASFVVTS